MNQYPSSEFDITESMASWSDRHDSDAKTWHDYRATIKSGGNSPDQTAILGTRVGKEHQAEAQTLAVEQAAYDQARAVVAQFCDEMTQLQKINGLDLKMAQQVKSFLRAEASDRSTKTDQFNPGIDLPTAVVLTAGLLAFILDRAGDLPLPVKQTIRGIVLLAIAGGLVGCGSVAFARGITGPEETKVALTGEALQSQVPPTNSPPTPEKPTGVPSKTKTPAPGTNTPRPSATQPAGTEGMTGTAAAPTLDGEGSPTQGAGSPTGGTDTPGADGTGTPPDGTPNPNATKTETATDPTDETEAPRPDWIEVKDVGGKDTIFYRGECDFDKIVFEKNYLGKTLETKNQPSEALYSLAYLTCVLPNGETLRVSAWEETDTLYHVMGDYSTANKTKGAAYDDGFRATIIKRLWGEGKQSVKLVQGWTGSGDLQALLGSIMAQLAPQVTDFTATGKAGEFGGKVVPTLSIWARNND
ncbi:MAG TPA: hypothetical protein DEP87_01795 [Candidatus Pacebacteria bacterium]|nr:hypothetical protein [Candidatus Paceibacterota bacterium]